MSRPLCFHLLQVCYFAAEAVDYICDQNDSTRSWHRINLQKIGCLKSSCCAQTEFTPVTESRLSVQISPRGSLTVRCLSELICQKVGRKKLHPWATNPHGVIFYIISTWKKKGTGLEKYKILSALSWYTCTGKLQTDAVVFWLMTVQSRMYDVISI